MVVVVDVILRDITTWPDGDTRLIDACEGSSRNTKFNSEVAGLGKKIKLVDPNPSTDECASLLALNVGPWNTKAPVPFGTLA